MTRLTRKSGAVTALAIAGALAVSLVGVAPQATAGPLCNTLSGETIATFTSCVVSDPGPGGQDSLTNVQNALNAAFALGAAPTLIPGQSYYPTNNPPGKAGDEFGADVPGLFEFTQIDDFTFSIEVVPFNTQFVTIKNANSFEIFNVFGETLPVELVSQIEQPGFSHFGTFAANILPPIQAPEPASLAMLGGALIGFGLLRRRKRG